MSDPQPPRRLVEALQSPASVVTYRAMVGFMMLVITGVLGFIGSSLIDGQQRLNDLMGKLEVTMAHEQGRTDEQGRRLDAHDAAIANLNQQTGNLDHRVTVIEAKQGMK